MAAQQISKADGNALIELLSSKYADNPQEFRSYMPEVAQMLDTFGSPHRQLARSSFGLTEREVKFHQSALTETLAAVTSGVATTAEAIKGLEHCAFLIRDDKMPAEADYEALCALFKAAFGKRPASFKKSEVIKVADGRTAADVVHKFSLVKGVSLELDREMRLISVSVSPRKVRQRRKLLSFVGAGHDTESDVAQRHDEYLARINPHGD